MCVHGVSNISCGVCERVGGMEGKLHGLMVGILCLIGDGDIMDAGANDGADSVLLSVLFPVRRIIAVEPLRSNVVRILKVKNDRMEVIEGGLGEKSGVSWYGVSADSKAAWPGAKHGRNQIGRLPFYKRKEDESRVNFTIYTVDEIFKDRRLAFAHWDVEGNEVNVLRGAVRTIERDRPIFTVETFPTWRPTEHRTLLSQIKEMNYSAHIISEKCGMKGCRNMICIPVEHKNMSKIQDSIRQYIL